MKQVKQIKWYMLVMLGMMLGGMEKAQGANPFFSFSSGSSSSSSSRSSGLSSQSSSSFSGVPKLNWQDAITSNKIIPVVIGWASICEAQGTWTKNDVLLTPKNNVVAFQKFCNSTTGCVQEYGNDWNMLCADEKIGAQYQALFEKYQEKASITICPKATDLGHVYQLMKGLSQAFNNLSRAPVIKICLCFNSEQERNNLIDACHFINFFCAGATRNYPFGQGQEGFMDLHQQFREPGSSSHNPPSAQKFDWNNVSVDVVDVLQPTKKKESINNSVILVRKDLNLGQYYSEMHNVPKIISYDFNAYKDVDIDGWYKLLLQEHLAGGGIKNITIYPSRLEPEHLYNMMLGIKGALQCNSSNNACVKILLPHLSPQNLNKLQVALGFLGQFQRIARGNNSLQPTGKNRQDFDDIYNKYVQTIQPSSPLLPAALQSQEPSFGDYKAKHECHMFVIKGALGDITSGRGGLRARGTSDPVDIVLAISTGKFFEQVMEGKLGNAIVFEIKDVLSKKSIPVGVFSFANDHAATKEFWPRKPAHIRDIWVSDLPILSCVNRQAADKACGELCGICGRFLDKSAQVKWPYPLMMPIFGLRAPGMEARFSVYAALYESVRRQNLREILPNEIGLCIDPWYDKTLGDIRETAGLVQNFAGRAHRELLANFQSYSPDVAGYLKLIATLGQQSSFSGFLVQPTLPTVPAIPTSLTTTPIVPVPQSLPVPQAPGTPRSSWLSMTAMRSFFVPRFQRAYGWCLNNKKIVVGSAFALTAFSYLAWAGKNRSSQASGGLTQ